MALSLFHRADPRHSAHATAAGATAVGAAAAGAFAVGAMAIGALAIGRLAIRKARIGNLDIDELRVRKIHPPATGAALGPASTADDTLAVADAYVGLCSEGRFQDAMDQLFSPDHVRVESLDTTEAPVETHGLAAIKERSREFADDNPVHDFTVEGPFVGDGRFAVHFAIDTTLTTGERATIPKMDLYTVRERRIIRSEVYYQNPSRSHDSVDVATGDSEAST